MNSVKEVPDLLEWGKKHIGWLLLGGGIVAGLVAFNLWNDAQEAADQSNRVSQIRCTLEGGIYCPKGSGTADGSSAVMLGVAAGIAVIAGVIVLANKQRNASAVVVTMAEKSPNDSPPPGFYLRSPDESRRQWWDGEQWTDIFREGQDAEDP